VDTPNGLWVVSLGSNPRQAKKVQLSFMVVCVRLSSKSLI